MFLHIISRFFGEIGDIVKSVANAAFCFLRSFENLSKTGCDCFFLSDADLAIRTQFQVLAKCRHRNRETHSILFRCYFYTDLFIFFIIPLIMIIDSNRTYVYE